MRIWCLSSLTVKEFERYPSLSSDYLKEAKSDIVEKYLQNAKNYELSEIRIGNRGYEFYFLFYRNNIKILDILMTRGVLTILPMYQRDLKYIDIVIGKNCNHYRDAEFPGNYIQNIRIRFIKNTSQRCMITSEEERMYYEYSNWINEYCNGNSEKEEEAFKIKGPLILPKQCKQKPLEQKIKDLYNAINDCCHCSTNRTFIDASKNRSCLPKKRYETPLKNDETFIFEQSCYEAYFEERKNFSYCQVLSYNSINLSKINEKWFLAKGLLSLSFSNMDIFKIPGTCEDFAKNISKLENLAILEMNNCKIREIPSYVYYELPISLTCIMLENNYLQRISPLISRLKFLMKFSVENNRNLSDDGFPWNDLPTNLMTLELGQTNLTKIPIEVKKLQNLNILGIQIPSLKEVEWDAITKGICALSVSNPQILTNQKASYAQSLTLQNAGLSNLEEIVLPSYVRELRLPINDLTSWDINLEDEKFSHLTIIDLSHNMLTWLPWESLPSTLESIDITNNLLEEVGSLKMLQNLKDLFLQHNFITKIASTDVYIQKIKTVNLSHNYLEELPQECKDKIYINISKNEDLKTLSFIPHIIHPVALANEKPNDEHLRFDDYEEQAAISTLDDEYVERSVIVSNIAHLRNTKNTARILHHTFNEVEENEFEKTSSCECCAYCNHEEADFHETVMIEQLVMAGWVLAVVDDDECHKDEAFRSAGWQAGKWKTLIRTRLCQICIQTLKNKSDTVNKEFMEIKKELKKPRIEVQTSGISDEKLAASNSQPLPTTEVDVEMALPNVQPQTEIAIAEINDVETENPYIQQIPEFTWILYILDSHPSYFENYSIIYYYPSEEYLRGICSQHGIFFQKYIFANFGNFYGSNIYNLRNLYTAKIFGNVESGYRALSYLFTGNTAAFESIKALIKRHIFLDIMPQNFYRIYEQQINFDDLSIKECELYAAANLFQLNILIFNYKNDGKWFILNESWLEREDNYTIFFPERPSILLSKDENGFYNAVLAVK